jgi:hypothetical protein
MASEPYGKAQPLNHYCGEPPCLFCDFFCETPLAHSPDTTFSISQKQEIPNNGQVWKTVWHFTDLRPMSNEC